MTENQPMYIMEDVSSPLKVECSSNINIRMRNNYSPPDLMSFFPSSHQTRHSTLLLYPMTILIPEHVPIRSHWPSGNAYPPGNDSLIAATIDSPPDICSFFPSHDQTLDPLHCFIL